MNVTIHRFDPDSGAKWTDHYEVPTEGKSLTVMDILDYISSHSDPTLAYYKHSACNHGICGRCSVRINGKVRLACITLAGDYEELELAPVPGRTVVRDLVVRT